MHATSSSIRHQQQRVRTLGAQSDSYDFFNMLTSDALLNNVEALLPEHRERLFPPTETLFTCIGSRYSIIKPRK